MTRNEAITELVRIWHSPHLDLILKARLAEAIDALKGEDGDLISRQAAIVAVENNSYGMGSRASVKAINSLPSAEADSDDLIIKGARGIQDGLYNIKDGKLSKYYAKGGIVQAYEIVPSTEAVQGEWVEEDEYSGLWVCDQCGFASEYMDNFCPNCGARMLGEDGEA